ncbi:hypothetical protein L218DRAFT_217619 [Marasmius fiardii PR-910]|nr:hypothetical protein L218DRAFT_217619 [Marasmius fiardii PR-910]
MAEEDHAGKKRRLQNACDECRRRKIRCDSATAPEGICSNCIAFKTECTHQLQKKKRGPKIGWDHQLPSKLPHGRLTMHPEDPHGKLIQLGPL